MEIEHDIKILTIDEHLESRVQELQAQGYNLMPGFKPVAIYPVMRVKETQRPAGEGDGMGIRQTMGVNDDLVGILRNGQIVKN